MTRVLKKTLWPHKIVFDTAQRACIDDILDWLREHVGAHAEQWYIVYQWEHTHFYFKHSRDATWFALRWS